LEHIARLASIDPTYPEAFARGVAAFRRADYHASAQAFRTWLDGHTDGALERLAKTTEPYDIVLLDVMLPGIDGFDVCRRIRARQAIPIVMLTARGDDTDRVVGLELGADAYVPQPFNPRELLARMRAVLRRAQPAPPPPSEPAELPGPIVVGDLTVDVPAHKG